MSITTLISARQLHASLDAGEPIVLVDTSFDLADVAAGERSHAQGHLPGAHYLHLERDLSGPKTGRNGRHPLPARAVFAALVGRLGITPATQVVAIDQQGGMYAARLWWMLRWLGHANVAVLDGGVAAWTAEGGMLDNHIPATANTAPAYPSREPPHEPLAVLVDADQLLTRLGRTPLLDARAAERFRGEVEPLDARAGHIPGARNRFFKDNLDANGRFKPAAALHAEFAPLVGASNPADVVHQCGSGVTACHNLLAMEVAGFTGSALYAGSWSEWSSDPGRPVAMG